MQTIMMIIALALGVGIIVLLAIFVAVTRLWLQAHLSGAHATFGSLLGMYLLKTNPFRA